jgi:Tol biopolymer transport system component
VDALPVDASGRNPKISPDGSLVAVHKFSASGGIWVTDLARRSMSPITFGRNDVSPVWSPRGKRLAFLRTGGKEAGVHIVDVTDASKDQFFEGTIGHSPESWSPDEKYLELQLQTGGMTLFAVDGRQKPIPVGSRKGTSREGKISPDGKFIAFTSNESGRDEIYVQAMPPATVYKTLSINGGRSPRWSHDGKELFFVSPDGEMMVVDTTLDPVNSQGVPHRLFQLKSGFPIDQVGSPYDVRPDGQQFLVFMRTQRGIQDAPITVVLNWWAELRQEP